MSKLLKYLQSEFDKDDLDCKQRYIQLQELLNKKGLSSEFLKKSSEYYEVKSHRAYLACRLVSGVNLGMLELTEPEKKYFIEILCDEVK